MDLSCIFGKFTIMKLFFWVILLPCVMVLIVICDMKRENVQHKITHEVYFDLRIGAHTTGKLTIGLFGETAPKTVHNFYTLATSGFRGYKYDGSRIHNVTKRSLIHGGDVVHGNGSGSISIYGPSFPDETFSVSYTASGFVGMFNKGRDSNGCQFFITTLPTKWLQGYHVAFGKVTKGMSTVHQIEYMPTKAGGEPLEEVIITKSTGSVIPNPYWISDDPYNLYDWLKIITFPLLLSAGIAYIFDHLSGKLDAIIDKSDKVVQEEKKKLLKADEASQTATSKPQAADDTSESVVKRRKAE